MTRHVVGPADLVPPGGCTRVVVEGRPIAVFNLGGSFYGLLDRCPHQGGPLSAGMVTGLMQSPAPGHYAMCRRGEIVRCPWHGWEFDIRTGQSHCDPGRFRTRSFPVMAAAGAALVEEPFVAETIEVRQENEYLVVEV